MFFGATDTRITGEIRKAGARIGWQFGLEESVQRLEMN
jgi:hypothetical protein